MAKFSSNIKQVQDNLRNAKITVATGVASDVTFASVKVGLALMKQRIFNKGLDADGRRFGGYVSDQYRKKRIRAGRRVDRKDLQFEGSLITGIQAFKEVGTKSTIKFVTQELADIGGYQESQIGAIRVGILPKKKNTRGRARKAPPVKIFKLTEKEKAEVRRQGKILLEQAIKDR